MENDAERLKTQAEKDKQNLTNMMEDLVGEEEAHAELKKAYHRLKEVEIGDSKAPNTRLNKG